MKDKILFWIKAVQYALMVVLCTLCVIATAAMPRWFLICTITVAGLILVSLVVMKLIPKVDPSKAA